MEESSPGDYSPFGPWLIRRLQSEMEASKACPQGEPKANEESTGA